MPVGGGAPIRTWLPECLDHGGEVYMFGNPSEWKSIYKATELSRFLPSTQAVETTPPHLS